MPNKKKKTTISDQSLHSTNSNLKSSVDNEITGESDSSKSNVQKQHIYISDVKFTIADIIQIILVVINIGMLIAFIVTSNQQNKNSLEALKQAEISNSFTRTSISLMDSSMKIDNRAYLVLQKISWGAFEYGKQSYFDVTLKNVGKTPAYSVGSPVLMKVYFNKSFDSIVLPEIKTNPDQTNIIGGGLEEVISVKSNYNPKREITSNDIIFIWGIITYKDIFKNIHYTQFSGSFDYSNRFIPSGNMNTAD